MKNENILNFKQIEKGKVCCQKYPQTEIIITHISVKLLLNTKL